jgi:hypothetical protein
MPAKLVPGLNREPVSSLMVIPHGFWFSPYDRYFSVKIDQFGKKSKSGKLFAGQTF